MDHAVRVLEIGNFDIARFDAAMDGGNLTSKDVAYKLLNSKPPWEAEVCFYGTVKQVHWNVLHFCLGYGPMERPHDG